MSELYPHEGRVTTVMGAHLYASWVHRADVDKLGHPYMQHLSRVERLCSGAAGVVALLHDIIEDHPEAADDLRHRVEPDVWEALVLLTRNKVTQTYDDYIRTIGTSGNLVAIEVKMADLCDHLRFGCPPSLVSRYLNALRVLHHLAGA